MKIAQVLSSSIERKIVMSMTGLFLISCLLISMAINGLISYNDGGKSFNIGAHFMGTNPLIRTIDIIVAFAFMLYSYQGVHLWIKIGVARLQGYMYKKVNLQAPWNSRSMTLLVTLILLLPIVHTTNFWIPNRLHHFQYGKELPLYEIRVEKFQYPLEVVLYTLACFSLFWHMPHEFRSALTTLGPIHTKWHGTIKFARVSFSIVFPTALAMMPITDFYNWIQ